MAGEALDGDIGCGLMPLLIINPFLIICYVYRGHSAEALKAGNLNEAKRCKNKFLLYLVLGILSLPLEVWLICKYVLKF